MKSKRTWWIGGLLGIAAVTIVAGFLLFPGAEEGGKSHDASPNILLITFDTTRADRIGAYGHPHARTPAIDSLAENGVLFDQVSAPVPLTLPSHSGMLTGLYPFYNGVRDNSTFSLDDQADTLAERLSRHGYQTGAVVAAFVLDSRFGLGQGFDDYRDDLPARQEFDRFQIPERNAQKIVDDAIDWLQSTKEDQPYFLWCHFYDPHHPYRTPTTFPFFLSHPYDQEIAFADYHLKRLLDHLAESSPNGRPTTIVFAGDHGEGFGEYGEETHGYFVYESTLRVPLIIKAADGAGAGKKIDTPVSLVDIMPTILDLAGLPVPAEDEVHGRSLVPLFKEDQESHEAQEAQEALADRPIYFECYSPMYSFDFAPVRGVRIGQAKFIDSPEAELYVLDENPREGPRHNVYQERGELADRMAQALDDLVDEELETPPFESEAESLDLEVIQKLKSLGYVAAKVTKQREWGPADDLKRMLPLYNRVLFASDTIGNGDVVAGAKILLEVLAERPNNPRALGLLAEVVATDLDAAAEGLSVLEAATKSADLDIAMRVPFIVDCGRAYLQKKDPNRAITFFHDAVEIEPDNPTYRMWICTAYLNLGQFGEAADAAEKASELAPDGVPIRIVLGFACLCNGELDRGTRVWHELLTREARPANVWEIARICSTNPAIAARAIGFLSRAAVAPDASSPVRAALHATNGQILLSAGQFDAGLSALTAACTLLEPDDVGGLWWRARALIYLDRLEEALELLKRAYTLKPDDIRIVTDLATTQHRLGSNAEAIATFSTYYEEFPEDPTAANNLAWMLAEHGTGEADLDRALELAKFAVKLRKGSAAFHDTLASVHLKRGDGVSAIHAANAAIRLEPDTAELHYHLGLAYRLDNQPDRTKEAFAKAVELAPTPRPPWFEGVRSVES